MRLCDYWIPRRDDRPDDPPSRCPTGPLRTTTELERLRCARCGGWAPHGALPSHERVAILTRELASLAGQLAGDYAWGHSVSFSPTRRSAGGGNGKGVHGDPTGNVVADETRLVVHAYTTIAARALERAVHELRVADEAIGDALLASEPPGPKDHTKAAFHDTGGLRYPEPGVYDAQARRHTRGEGIPT